MVFGFLLPFKCSLVFELVGSLASVNFVRNAVLGEGPSKNKHFATQDFELNFASKNEFMDNFDDVGLNLRLLHTPGLLSIKRVGAGSLSQWNFALFVHNTTKLN
jgi:hypothetical protein